MEIKLEKQILKEMARVGEARKDKGYKHDYVIYVDSDAGNRRGDAYFKVYDALSYSTADRVARIKFMVASSVTSHTDSKKPITINNPFKEDLIKFLMSEHKYVHVTNWVAALYTWNQECGLDVSDLVSFSKGDYDDTYKEDPRYLASTTVMPDYNLL